MIHLTAQELTIFNGLVADYAKDMIWDKGMIDHPGDYFVDTASVIAEIFPTKTDKDIAEMKARLEADVIVTLMAQPPVYGDINNGYDKTLTWEEIMAEVKKNPPQPQDDDGPFYICNDGISWSCREIWAIIND